MRLANKYLNLHRTVAMEPVFNDKREVSKIRVIPAHKFLVVDDGTIDGNVVAFIKIISHDLVHVYTEQEFFFLNIETGSVSDVVPNTAGRIPVVVLTRDCVTAMPPEDVDTYQMVTLLPLLLTDLNYALKFQCFSIIYTVDVDPSKIILAPNAVWPLQTLDSGMDDKRKPEIGTIKPEVATGDIIDALTTQYNLWLESRNIKLGSIGKGGSVDNLSGIAKAIDNADIESDINYQRELFVQAEKKIFELLSNYSNYDLKGTVTSFEDRPVFSKESKKEKGERLAAEVSAGLTNKREAIKELHPEYDESLIEETVNGMGT
jgi:hypothetical protein